MCLGLIRYFSIKMLGLPKAESEDERANSRFFSRSSFFSTTPMLIPPPPAEDFRITGKPISLAISNASSSSTAPSLPGVMGMPSFFTKLREAILSPAFAIAQKSGPIKMMLFSSHLKANSEFSAKKP